MATATPRKLFVNLPVRDLKKSMSFFGALGFTFNPQFTDENAACMVFSEDGFAMLLQEPFFKTFTTRPIADARQQTEGIFALTCTSRAEVDELLKKALAAGATPAMPSQDHGFMYSNSFYDLDGHHWELFWMESGAHPEVIEAAGFQLDHEARTECEVLASQEKVMTVAKPSTLALLLLTATCTAPIAAQNVSTPRGTAQPPGLSLALTLRIQVGPPAEIGEVPRGRRRVIPILGGSFEGVGVRGKVLPGGADWQIVRQDGFAELDARYTLQTDTGTLIYVQNLGIRHAAPEVMKKLVAGEAVDPGLVYFMTSPTFETSGSDLQWLTRSIFVGSGERHPTEVVIRVWRVESS